MTDNITHHRYVLETTQYELAEAKRKMAYATVKPKFSVLLQRPDYIGEDTYFTTVAAESPAEALAAARAEAMVADEADEEYTDPIDYTCLLLVAGDVADLNPEF
jgi:hypothetical protein